MYERGKRESAAAEALRGWTFVPIVDESSDTHSVGRYRLPARFGGWWRHHDLDDDGQLEAPSGKEIILRLRIVEGQVRTDEVTFKGFEDEFERQGVPAMRDMTMQVFSVLDGRDLSGSLAGMMRAVPMDDREQALGEHRRRRRRNAVDHERVAELYRSGGARQIAETEVVSEATAYRWVKSARLAGVLEERA